MATNDVLTTTNTDNHSEDSDEDLRPEAVTATDDVARINMTLEALGRHIRALASERNRLRLELKRDHERTHAPDTASDVSQPIMEYDK